MKKKRIIIIAGACVLVAVSAVGFVLTRGLSYLRDTQMQGIDLTDIADGRHTGAFELGRFSNTLTVYVEGNRIVDISIDDDVFAAGITGASNEVFSRVIAAQNTIIDAVSGATATTNAYLKAVENALGGDR